VEARGHRADEQAALRRVAVLAASGAPPEEVFAAVAAEAGHLLSTDVTGVFRYDPDDATTCVGEWDSGSGKPPFTVGTRLRLGGHNTLTLISRTGRSARVEQAEPASGDVTSVGRKLGYGPVAGAPVTVDGRLWGAIAAMACAGETLPLTTEGRLAQFAELAAITIAGTAARMALSSFAEEQAALRRVATLAARGAPPEEMFLAVSAEAQQLLSADITDIVRYDPGGAATSVGWWTREGPSPFNGTAVRLGGRNILTKIFETGQPTRLDSMDDGSGEPAVVGRQHGFRSAVGAPITVDGRLWGVMMVGSTSEKLWPPDTEARLAGFTELAATAIANAEARTELRDFAAEQAALRRVASLVARAAPPAEVFAAVTEEIRRLLDTDVCGISRYEPDGTITSLNMATSGAAVPVPSGSRFGVTGFNTTSLVFQTGQPARIDDFTEATGPTAGPIKTVMGIRAVVSVPVRVAGRLWGIMSAMSTRGPLPAGTEEQLARFTELTGNAIANAEARAALTVSRARIVAAADATRRGIERQLNEAAQERLVSLARQLRAAQAAAPAGGGLRLRLERMITETDGVLEQLREIARGLHPAVLAEGGLGPALTVLAARSAVPVRLDVRVAGRLPETAELTAYYAVSETLTNIAKHAHASAAQVDVAAEPGRLRVLVRDDGRGGADFSRGSGLAGLRDRVEAVGGQISLRSEPGAGTTVEITLPFREPAIAG
jgi:GAF domain-containing protein